jgi:hypothetical protein
MTVLRDLTGLEKRALASKYLHFHLPRLFFIYDSRAAGVMRRVSPPRQRYAARRANGGDSSMRYSWRVRWRFGRNLKKGSENRSAPGSSIACCSGLMHAAHTNATEVQATADCHACSLCGLLGPSHHRRPCQVETVS